MKTARPELVFGWPGIATESRPDGITQMWRTIGRGRTINDRYAGVIAQTCYEGEVVPGLAAGHPFRVTYRQDTTDPVEAARLLRIVTLRLGEAAMRAAAAEDFGRADRLFDSIAELSGQADFLEELTAPRAQAVAA